MKAPKPMFTVAQAAELASEPAPTVRDWFADKPRRPALFWLDDKLDRAAGQGGTRYLSINTTLAVCIAAEFNHLGIPIERAAKAGLEFAFTLHGSRPRKNGHPLYGGHDLTIIALWPDDNVKIFPLGPKTKYDDVLRHMGFGGANSAAMVIVDPIVERIQKAALG
jgi:hypothetical protein